MAMDAWAHFRQYQDRVEVLQDPTTSIEFDNVTGNDCEMQKDIAASIYDVQVHLFNALRYERIEPAMLGALEEEYRKLKLENAAALTKMYRAAVG